MPSTTFESGECSYINENLVEMLCNFNNCDPYSLTRLLKKRKRANLKFLRENPLMTMHLRHNQCVFPDDFSFIGANRLFAYQGFLRITVQQHLYTRHRVKLKFPKLPCVVMHCNNGHRNYFPLELLQLI